MFQESLCVFSVTNISLKNKDYFLQSYLWNLGGLRDLSFLIRIYKKSMTLI